MFKLDFKNVLWNTKLLIVTIVVYVCWEPHTSMIYVNNWVNDINQIMVLG